MRRKKPDLFVICFAAAGSLLLLFVILPLLGTLVSTTPAALGTALADAQVMDALGLTFYSGAWATLLAMLTGVPLAYLLARYDFAGKRLVEGIVNLPIVVPHTAAGIALLMVFGRQAPIGQA